ncbi:MAG: thioredoxin family protein [Isosphaeraceae bacterium]|nr:thioredoxin family protein [Isosphaeraceae bacterium]
MDWSNVFEDARGYDEFLAQYATPPQLERWRSMHDRIVLSDDQRSLLAGFTRTMPVLVMAGAWCGDCVNQVPILAHFATAASAIRLRIIDRDAREDVARALSINGGKRVPAVLFLSEDFQETARYGERTLAAYRRLAADQLGGACPTGIVPPSEELVAAVTKEWLEQFERVHLILRLSTRLREKHGD